MRRRGSVVWHSTTSLAILRAHVADQRCTCTSLPGATMDRLLFFSFISPSQPLATARRHLYRSARDDLDGLSLQALRPHPPARLLLPLDGPGQPGLCHASPPSGACPTTAAPAITTATAAAFRPSGHHHASFPFIERSPAAQRRRWRIIRSGALQPPRRHSRGRSSDSSSAAFRRAAAYSAPEARCFGRSTTLSWATGVAAPAITAARPPSAVAASLPAATAAPASVSTTASAAPLASAPRLHIADCATRRHSRSHCHCTPLPCGSYRATAIAHAC